MMAWYVVYTQPQRENQAAQHLRNQGFEVYLPLYRKTRRHAGRTDLVQAPLFPRYLFAGIDLETQRWRSVNGTVGVVGMVMGGGQPLVVAEEIIAAIRAREDDAGFVQLSAAGFQLGQALRITAGPMADTQGLFEEVIDGNRAILLVSLLGRTVRVKMPIQLIEAA